MEILYVVLSSIFFGIMPSVQNVVSDQGVSSTAVVAFTMLFSTVVSFIVCKVRGISLKVTKRQLIEMIILGAFVLAVTDICLNTGYTYLPVGLVTVLHYLYPVLVAIFSAIFFKEKITRNVLLTIILALIGLVVMAIPYLSANFIGVTLGLISAVTYGVYILLLDKLEMTSLNVVVKNFYLSMFNGIASFAVVLTSKGQMPTTVSQIGFLFIAGVLLMLGAIFLNLGVVKVGATMTAFISLLEPIISVILTIVIFREEVNAYELVGCLFILLAEVPLILNKKENTLLD